MAKIRPYLHVSASLKEMILKHRADSVSLRVLARILEAQDGRPDIALKGRDSWGYRHRRHPSKNCLFINEKQPGDYYAFREKKGMISYCPAGREQKIEMGKWLLDGRQAMKPGAWLRKVLNPRTIRFLKIKDHDFSPLAEVIRLDELSRELSYETVSFEDGYNRDKYTRGRVDSCMFGLPVGDFYRAFGAECLICKDGGGAFRGRAVLWRNVEVVSGMKSGEEKRIVLIDRIYADSEEVVRGIFDYGNSQGWWHKLRQSKDYKTEIAMGGDSRKCTLRVERVEEYLPSWKPYMDTMSFMTGRFLSNVRDDDSEYQLSDTRGSWIDIRIPMVITVDGVRMRQDRCVHYRKANVWYPRNDPRVVSDFTGSLILRENAKEVEGHWFEAGNPNVVWSEPEARWIFRDNSITIDGKNYHRSSGTVVRVEPGGEWAIRTECEMVTRFFMEMRERNCWCKRDNRIVRADDGTWVFRSQAVDIDGTFYTPDSKRIVRTSDGFRLLTAGEIEDRDKKDQKKREAALRGEKHPFSYFHHVAQTTTTYI